MNNMNGKKKKLSAKQREELLYDHVFVYHNGAGASYGVRGFRGSLRV
jgi:hypothetical protein